METITLPKTLIRGLILSTTNDTTAETLRAALHEDIHTIRLSMRKTLFGDFIYDGQGRLGEDLLNSVIEHLPDYTAFNLNQLSKNNLEGQAPDLTKSAFFADEKQGEWWELAKL